MRNRILALLLLALPASAQDAPELTERILQDCVSKDPFTSYQALKDVEAWAVGRAGAREKLAAMRDGASGNLLLGIDEALVDLARKAGEAPPLPELEDDRFGDLLERIASIDSYTARWAMRDLDSLCGKDDAELRRKIEAKRGGASARRLEGIRSALERIAAWEKSRALEAAATTEDEKGVRTLLHDAAIESRVGSESAIGKLRDWISRDPEKLYGLVKPWKSHADARVSRAAAAILAPIEDLMPWLPVCRSLDGLGMPTVEGVARLQAKPPERAVLPEPLSPRIPGLVGCWGIGYLRSRYIVMYDDGSVRITGEAHPEFFGNETRAWDDARSPEPASYDADGFWQAALYGRWWLQRHRLGSALACFEAARKAASIAWPGEPVEKLAERALRLGADRLLRVAKEGCGSEDLDVQLWQRIAELPFADCREFAAPRLEGWRRHQLLTKKWSGQAPGDRAKLGVPDRVEEAFWAMAESGSTIAEKAGPAALLDEIARADPESSDPFARVAACGLDALPFLIDRLDDRTPIAIPRGDGQATAADAALLLVNFLLRMPLPATRADDAPWLDLTAPAADVQRDLRALWARLAPLDDPARRLALFRAGSRAAEDWLLRHDPAACAAEALKALPADGRARILGARRIAGLMSEAPAEKLNALRDSSEGVLRELVEQAIEVKEAPREK